MMTEYIGFFISILALVYLYIKQSSPPREGEGTASFNGSEEGEEADDPFSAIMKEMERRAAVGKVVEKRPKEEVVLLPLPPAKSKVVKKRSSSRSLEERPLTSSLKERELRNSLEKRRGKPKGASSSKNEKIVLLPPPNHGKKSRAADVVSRLAKRSDMIIYQEIIGKPKSLRSENFYQ